MPKAVTVVKEGKLKFGTVIKRCPDCKPHSHQDKTYGNLMRIMNLRKNGGCRCTICLKTYEP